MAVVSPMPPVVSGWVPWVQAGWALVRDPAAFFTAARTRHGDTFVVRAFGRNLLCLFSAAGVRGLWALPEADASKGLADFELLGHKVPPELFTERRTYPHGLFGREDTEVYLGNLAEALTSSLEELGQAGRFELFAFTRRLAHRMGLASWGGRAAATPPYVDALIEALDRLDAAESFVHPTRALWTFVTRRGSERAALARIEAMYAEMLAAMAPVDPTSRDLFDRIRLVWAEAPRAVRDRGIARDVVVVHMGSQSNLFAAMAWTCVRLLQHPGLAEDAALAWKRGDSTLLESVANESIRLAQRSIVLRKVVRPIAVMTEHTSYTVAPGAFVATMVAVTNTTACDGLAAFEPRNYTGRTFTRSADVPARELVTTFGHGRHACPAQRFSVSAIVAAVGALFDRFRLTPRFETPRPLRHQIGGVARADRPCVVEYERRA